MASEPISEMLNGILEALPNPVFVKDERHRWVLLNDSFCRFIGHGRELLLGKSDYDFFPKEQANVFHKKDDEVFASGGINENEESITDSAGREHVIVTRKTLYTDHQGNRFLVGVITDITDRKRAEGSVRESEQWLRRSQDIARIGHYVYDIHRNHWTSSATLNAIFGIDEEHPRTAEDWANIVHPDDRASMGAYLASVISGAARFDLEYRVVDHSRGEVRWVHGLGDLQRNAEGVPIKLVGTIQDVTVRKKAEAERDALQTQLALASRLAAMGTLVAGVAHEINNPLSAQLAGQGIALELARDARMRRQQGTRLGLEEEVHLLDDVIEALEDAQEGGQRVARIVKDMAAFGSPDPRRARVRISDIVADAMRWMPASVAMVATVIVESRDPPDVMASAGQIEQVVVNLVTNAAKATPAGKLGEITIRTSAGLGGMARLEVIDHGTGIAPAILGRIFEPFFTTRQLGEGKGAGLGLAVCHAIVTSHGGTLTFESEVGKGSTFRMDLPAAPDEA
jgi:PAS domain S-box-containing protein